MLLANQGQNAELPEKSLCIESLGLQISLAQPEKRHYLAGLQCRDRVLFIQRHRAPSFNLTVQSSLKSKLQSIPSKQAPSPGKSGWASLTAHFALDDDPCSLGVVALQLQFCTETLAEKMNSQSRLI